MTAALTTWMTARTIGALVPAITRSWPLLVGALTAWAGKRHDLPWYALDQSAAP